MCWRGGARAVSDFGTPAVIAGEVGSGYRSDGPEPELMTLSRHHLRKFRYADQGA
jgi:hypothetical protein